MNSRPGEIIPQMAQDLESIGARSGDILVLHSSFKSLGLRGSGPVDVIRTLVEFLGDKGTLMAPTFTYSYSGIWNVQPFNADTTPGINNGILTETLRKYPGALRSAHPTYSVAAIGKHAEQITRDKDKPGTSALGIGSSYDEAVKLNAKILLLGVGNDRNSMIHHAEAVAELPFNHVPFREFWGKTALVEKDGETVEVLLKEEYPNCSANFGNADEYLARMGVLTTGRVLAADCMLMNARTMVETISERLKREPAWLLCNGISCEPCTIRRRLLKKMGLI